MHLSYLSPSDLSSRHLSGGLQQRYQHQWYQRFASVMAHLLMCVLLFLSLPTNAGDYTTIEWIDLLPKADLEALSNAPPISHDTLMLEQDNSIENDISNAIGKAMSQTPDSAYQRALVSTNVQPQYNKKKIRIAGFIVPLEFNDDQIVTEFFIVPFFGACIHVPPPPPNQIILAKSKKGIQLDDIYFPYWIEGTLNTEKVIEHNLAKAAYQLSVDKVSEYKQ